MKKKKVWRYNWSHTVKWRTFIHCHVCRVNSNLDSSFKETKWTLWNLFIKHILWRGLGPFRKRNNAELWEQTRVEICTVKRSKHRNGRCQVLTRPCRNVSMWHLDTLLFCMLNILNGNKSQLYLHMNTNSMCLKSSFGRHLLMWSMKKNKTGGGHCIFRELLKYIKWYPPFWLPGSKLKEHSANTNLISYCGNKGANGNEPWW